MLAGRRSTPSAGALAAFARSSPAPEESPIRPGGAQSPPLFQGGLSPIQSPGQADITPSTTGLPARRRASDVFDDDAESSQPRTKRAHINEDDIIELTEKAGMDFTETTEVIQFCKLPPHLRDASLLITLRQNNRMLRQLLADENADLAKAPAFREHVRRLFTAWIISSKVHFCGPRATREYLAFIKDNPKAFGLEKRIFDRDSIWSIARDTARGQIRQVRYRLRKKLEASIANEEHIGLLASSIVDSRDVTTMSANHLQIALLRWSVAAWHDTPKEISFWKFVDVQMINFIRIEGQNTTARFQLKLKKMLDKVLNADLTNYPGDQADHIAAAADDNSATERILAKMVGKLSRLDAPSWQKAVEKASALDVKEVANDNTPSAEDEDDDEDEDGHPNTGTARRSRAPTAPPPNI